MVPAAADTAISALLAASDSWIIAIVAVGFPLCGLGVFFFWRWQYGVWSLNRRERDDGGREVVHVPMDSSAGAGNATKRQR